MQPIPEAHIALIKNKLNSDVSYELRPVQSLKLVRIRILIDMCISSASSSNKRLLYLHIQQKKQDNSVKFSTTKCLFIYTN